jgi:hypothetical protein
MTTEPDCPGPQRPPCSVAPGRLHSTSSLKPVRLRTLSLAVAIVAVWGGIMLDPIIGPFVVSIVGGVAIGVLLILGAMGLGGIGLGLFALGDRAVAWVRRVSRWPE